MVEAPFASGRVADGAAPVGSSYRPRTPNGQREVFRCSAPGVVYNQVGPVPAPGRPGAAALVAF